MNRNLILSACCLSGAVMAGCSEKLPQKPNIIFIYADDIGYGDLECYGATCSADSECKQACRTRG